MSVPALSTTLSSPAAAAAGGFGPVLPGAAVRRVEVPGATLVYEDAGAPGDPRPAVLCLPSMGDVRQEYRMLAPRLQALGFRVLAMELRGHGDSEVAPGPFGPAELGRDALAVLDHAGVERAFLIGCSISGGAVAWAAAEAPSRVLGLVLIGAFVRDVSGGWLLRALLPLLFARPWGAAAWAAFYRSLYKERPPADLDDYVRALRATLRRPGRLAALRAIARSSKGDVPARLAAVRAPSVVIYGGRDPDFSDPAAEAEHVRGALGGPARVEILPGLGHYPHVEEPDAVATRVLDLAREAGHAPA